MLSSESTRVAAFYNIFYFILSMMHFCYGLSEAIILSQTMDSKRDCGPGIWYCIMSCCIINFFMFVIVLLKVVTANKEHEIAQNLRYTLFLVRVWACVCMYDTSLECIAHFEDNYGRLWSMIRLETITFILFVTFVGVIMVATCVIPACTGLTVSGSDDDSTENDKPVTRAEFNSLIDKVNEIVGLTENIRQGLNGLARVQRTDANANLELDRTVHQPTDRLGTRQPDTAHQPTTQDSTQDTDKTASTLVTGIDHVQFGCEMK